MLKPLLAASILCVNALTSSVASRPVETVGAWTRTCATSGDACVLSQSIAPNKQGVWANLVVGRVGTDVQLILDTPRLSHGQLILVVDHARPIILDTEECTWQGCRVRLNLTPAQAARLAEARSIEIVMPLDGGRAGRLDVEFDQLGRALETLPVTL